jgi:hypothetical protein
MSTIAYLAALLAVLVIFAAVIAVAIASHFDGDTGSDDCHP